VGWKVIQPENIAQTHIIFKAAVIRRTSCTNLSG